MTTPDDIEGRLSAVEREVAELREQTRLGSTDASAARTLAAGADRDVSEVRAELRAHTRALNALRETQLETVESLARMGGRFDSVDGRLGSLEGHLGSLDGRTGSLEGLLGSLDGQLGSLDGRMGSLEGHLGSLDGRMGSLEGHLGSLDGRTGSLEGHLGSLDGRTGSLEGHLESLDGRMGSLQGSTAAGFATLGAGVDQIVTLLDELRRRDT